MLTGTHILGIFKCLPLAHDIILHSGIIPPNTAEQISEVFNGRNKSTKQIYGMGLGFRALSEPLRALPCIGLILEKPVAKGLCCMYNLSLFFFPSFPFMTIGENMKQKWGALLFQNAL